jgi:hypothetical protein
MVAEKGGGPTRRRKGNAGRDGGERLGPTVAKADQDGTVVNVDPWGSFFETFWGQAEGERADRRDGEPRPVKGPRKTGTKPDR